MLSAALRVARPGLCRAAGRRFASNEAPQYNEPSGYLFGEKVSWSTSVLAPSQAHPVVFVASATWAETCEGGLGEYLVLGNVWFHGVCSCDAVLQA